jgi:hypothetical protein
MPDGVGQFMKDGGIITNGVSLLHTTYL